ncbi:uncharacterized protein LOC123685292 [Harmonia axyridis]|uniref:uncharacterized protein LOC123685292 n=1 Tax=Harmonia axyridis TaxID=115357 RepID=UPI001E277164|nr:uncharacterized protein LOC123685292 [Harmonia axyridis]
MYESALFIRGQLRKTAGAGTLKLVNNYGAFFFDSITYELCGTEVETIEDPGRVSLIRGFLCYEKGDNSELNEAGWNFPDEPLQNDDGTFAIRIPLKHLLNVFNDYPKAMCGKQVIRLIRARNDSNCMIITAGTGEQNGATKGQITISDIELRVKHVHPNDEIKLNLLSMIKSDKPILIPFRKWEVHQLPVLRAGATQELWRIKTGAIVECPRYVICCFHSDRKDNPTKDPNYFENVDTSDIRVLLNGEYYPQERLRLNFDQNDYSEAHYNYCEFAKTYTGRRTGNTAVLDYGEYKSHFLFVIVCSKRDETYKFATVDVKLEIEARKGFPANTRVYCVIFHDNVIEYQPPSEIIRKLTNF